VITRVGGERGSHRIVRYVSHRWPGHRRRRRDCGAAQSTVGEIATGSRREFTEHGEHDRRDVWGLRRVYSAVHEQDSTNGLKEQAMAKVFNGRYMADAGRLGDEVVVFIVGMRINKPLKVRQWWIVFSAMPRMMMYLKRHPEKGMLAYRQSVFPFFFVQYWRSFEDLERFARNTDDPHLEPLRRFNQKISNTGDVGIWHETYRVKTSDIESIYGNMPLQGLGAAATVVPVGHGKESAAVRLGVTDSDNPALPGY
jgi:Domain of unknown function (DUF4188)